MSWLGNGFREEAKALADAYAAMYAAAEESEVIDEGYTGAIANSTARVGKSVADAAMNVARGAAGAVGGAAKNVHNAVAKDISTNKKPQLEDFENWVNQVIAEGADLSEYTWDEVYDYYVNLNETSRERATGAYAERSARTRDYEDTYQDRDPRGRTKSGKDKSRETLRRLMDRFGKKAGDDAEKKARKYYGEEDDLLASLADAYNMMYEKKKDSDKCGEDTYWDSEEKKCKSKKKKSNTTVVVGRGGYYGGGHHHGGSNGGESGGEGETEGGTDGGGDGGGGGGE